VSTQTEVKTLPTRHEVPVELTWDLSVVYADDSDWERDFGKLEDALAPLAAMQGTLHNGWSLLHALQAQDEAGILLSQLYSYASLRRSEDNADATAQARVERIKMLSTRLASASAFLDPEILELDPETIRTFIDEQPGLKLYEYYLHKLERRRAHTRSTEVEDVLAQAYEATSGTSTVYKMFGDADLKFPNVRDDKGVEHELTHGRYIKFLESPDRSLRETAFKIMHGEYAKWRNTLAASLSGAVKADVFSARVRKYDSALHAALEPDEIPTEVYTNLIGAVRERLPVLHRYLRLRKKLLKLDDLQMWDLYVPMVEQVEKPISYDEAKEAVRLSLRPMGEEYGRVLDQAFSKRWIDVLENEGKTSGAFFGWRLHHAALHPDELAGQPQQHFTLAHELGHSLHSFFARETQPYVYAGYTIFVAEVASTLNEALLTHHMQQQARESGDRA
jgi:oligoendopeptidase F